MEGMIVGARQAHYAFGNQTLVRYLRAQLRILRDELERLQVPFRKRGVGITQTCAAPVAGQARSIRPK